MPDTLSFTLDDQRHLLAAEGWLDLGMPREANAELENIQAHLRSHPDVLEIRWHIYAKESKWEACVDIANATIKSAPDRSDGWIHRSFALHEMKHTQEALDLLLPVADKFPKVWTVPYNLACYTSVLHRLDESKMWLEKAIGVGGNSVKLAALEDPDLKPLWDSLGGDREERHNGNIQ